MSTKCRASGWLLSAAVAVALAPAAFAAHGGGGGGGGGGHMSGGFGGGGWSGGHMSSGGWSGARISGGNWSGMSSSPGRSQFSHAWSPGSVSNAARTQSFNNWNHPWNANNGVWNHNQAWWGHHEPDRDDFFRFGLFGWPWFAFDWGPGYWWPNYYDYGYAPYGDYYSATPYTSAYAPSSEAIVPPGNAEQASGFYEQALAAFRQGEYGQATRLAGHAAVDDPRNPDVHILAMLGLFAMGEYRGAAMEAHAVTALGHIPDWPALYSIYGSVGPYTEHLRKLERFVGENPSAPEGRFLLGFQYLMENYRDAAKVELLHALKLTPRDTLAARLLTQAGGTVPADIGQQQSQPIAAEKGGAAQATSPEGAKAPDSAVPAAPVVPPAPPQP